MNRRPTAVKETKPVYNNNGTIDFNPFESSSSTLGAHGAGQQKSQNELIPRINQNRGATMDNFTDFLSKEVFQIVLHNLTTSHRFMKFVRAEHAQRILSFYKRYVSRVSKHLNYLLRFKMIFMAAICYSLIQEKGQSPLRLQALFFCTSLSFGKLLLQGELCIMIGLIMWNLLHVAHDGPISVY